MFSSLCRRDTLSLGDTLNLASFLGEQLRNLHLLPLPSLNAATFVNTEQEIEDHWVNDLMEAVTEKLSIPVEWNFFIRTLTKRRKDVSSRLTKWYVQQSSLNKFVGCLA